MVNAQETPTGRPSGSIQRAGCHSRPVTTTFRQQLTSRPVRVALLIGVLAVILLFVVDRAPKGIEASGTIDQCHWGWPIVHLDSDDWVRALPPHPQAPRIPAGRRVAGRDVLRRRPRVSCATVAELSHSGGESECRSRAR